MKTPPSDRDEIKLFFNYDRKYMESEHKAYFLTDDEEKSGKYKFKPIIAGICQ